MFSQSLNVLHGNESRSVMSDSLHPHGLYIVHGILLTRILEWVNFCFSKGSSQPRDQTQVSCIAGGFFTSWATSSVQLCRVRLFVNPWNAARQASLSINNSQSLLKLKSIESVMPSNHLILFHFLLLLPSNLSQHQGLFKWVSSLHQLAKVLESQLQHQSFQWTFRTDFL